jgi:hypothetical protein
MDKGRQAHTPIFYIKTMNMLQTKERALIAVDKIIVSLQNQINQVNNIDIVYWEKVKQEINKL